MPAEIILTGSRGRLATTLRAALVPAGWRVHSFSRSAGGVHLALSDLFTSGVLERSAGLVHLAWSTVPLTSERHVGMEWKEDIPLLVELLRTISVLPAGTRPHFMFFSSGGAIYGNARDRPSREEDTPAPIGWHGVCKVSAEAVVRDFGDRYGLSYTIFRLSNPYGFAAADHRPQGVIPRLIDASQRGDEFTVWGDGRARKDFLFHTDMSAAVSAALELRLQGTFNLCAGVSHSVAEIIGIIERQTNRKLELRYAPAEAYPWDVTNSQLDNARLSAALGWQPRVCLEDGIARTIEALMPGAP